MNAREELAAALEAGGANYLHINVGRVLDALLPVVDRIAAAERQRVLRDVVHRLRGFRVDPAVIEHFAALAVRADAIEAGTKAAGT